MQTILKNVLLVFVFVVLVGIVFFGVQWFSQSVGTFFNGQLSGSLQFFPASVVSASVDGVEIKADTQLPVALPDAPVYVPQLAVVPVPKKPAALQLVAEAALSVQVGVDEDSADGVTTQKKMLFHKNENEKLPVASLTKLMTALLVLENYNLNQKIIIDQAAMDQVGEQGGLELGQTLSVKNLLHIALMESSNRAAYALSEVTGPGAFVEAMNARAQALGLTNTHFQDSTGLDSGSYSTAQDIATLTEYLFDHQPLFREIVGLKEYDLYLDDGSFHHRLISTNKLLGERGILGGKTGFTTDAKGCFVVIESLPGASDASPNNPPQPYIINVVLGSDDRFFEMQQIINWITTHNGW